LIKIIFYKLGIAGGDSTGYLQPTIFCIIHIPHETKSFDCNDLYVIERKILHYDLYTQACSICTPISYMRIDLGYINIVQTKLRCSSKMNGVREKSALEFLSLELALLGSGCSWEQYRSAHPQERAPQVGRRIGSLSV
jgi:hypothetical protein